VNQSIFTWSFPKILGWKTPYFTAIKKIKLIMKRICGIESHIHDIPYDCFDHIALYMKSSRDAHSFLLASTTIRHVGFRLESQGFKNINFVMRINTNYNPPKYLKNTNVMFPYVRLLDIINGKTDRNISRSCNLNHLNSWCGALFSLKILFPKVNSMFYNGLNIARINHKMEIPLESLIIKNENSLKEIIPMNSIKKINLIGLKMLEALPMFPCLEYLHIVNCRKLVGISVYPFLHTIIMDNCPKFRFFPDQPKLKKYYFDLTVRNLHDSSYIKCLPPLQSLEIFGSNISELLEKNPTIIQRVKTLSLTSNKIDILPDLPNVIHIMANNCPRLLKIGNIPEAKSVNVYGSKKLCIIGWCPKLERLAAHQCHNLKGPIRSAKLSSLQIQSLGLLQKNDIAKQLKILDCSGSNVVEVLLSMPLITRLYARDCPKLKKFGEMPMIEQIYFDRSKNVVHLPYSKNIKMVSCEGVSCLNVDVRMNSLLRLGSKNTPIIGLEAQPYLRKLLCNTLFMLNTLLPQAMSLKKLYIVNCNNLMSLPILPNIEILYLNGCRDLSFLPIAPRVQRLVISRCVNLKRIMKTVDNLIFIQASFCTNLIELPDMFSLEGLYINNCIWLKKVGRCPSLFFKNILFTNDVNKPLEKAKKIIEIKKAGFGFFRDRKMYPELNKINVITID